MTIPDGAEIGVDLELDRRRGFTVSPGGVVVVPVMEGSEELFAAESSVTRGG